MFRRFPLRFCASATASAAASTTTTTTAANSNNTTVLSALELTPKKVVEILDNYIVGQKDAKRAVAVALRNRWRRSELKDLELKNDVVPKNILMVGPTGVGKTEIARRMAKLTDAPFLKVEATKYTEVGFKGKDVESIIEELYTASKHKARSRLEREKDTEATQMARDLIWNAVTKTVAAYSELTFEQFLEKLEAGVLDDVVVPVQTTVAPDPTQQMGGGNPFGIPGIILQSAGGEFGFGPKGQRQTLLRPVPEALKLAKNESFGKMIDDSHVAASAKKICEEEGIVFLDEIDKVVADAKTASSDASSLGVQQDLLPLVEGSNVTMKDGSVIATENILFICSGAFHVVKPSDMIAELQGRLPVRVELKALTEEEFRRILTEPKFNLLRQQKALLETEGVELEFDESGISSLANTATVINQSAQNIGARRLQTIIEKVLEDVSFEVDNYIGKKTVVNKEWVDKSTDKLKTNVDLAKYLL